MEKIYKFHYDGGHGWLEVDLNDIENRGIANQISSYSYVNSENVYLEEDCDAALMGKVPYAEVNDGDNSFIRNFEHYKGGGK